MESWLIRVLLAAVFAALTAILGQVGVGGEVEQSAAVSVEALQEFDAGWVFPSDNNDTGETPEPAISKMDALLPSWCVALNGCQQGRVIPVPIVEAASWSPDAFFADNMMLIGTMANPMIYR